MLLQFSFNLIKQSGFSLHLNNDEVLPKFLDAFMVATLNDAFSRRVQNDIFLSLYFIPFLFILFVR